MRKIILIKIMLITMALGADFTLSPDWHLNDLCEELELRGIVPKLPGVKPYSSDVLLAACKAYPHAFYARRVSRLIDRRSIPDVGWIYWTPGVWFGNRWDSRLREFGRMNLGVGGMHSDFTILGIYRLDSGYYYDPEYFGARWERIAGKADQVYLRWRKGDYYVQFGRDYLSYGLGVALSGAKPFEMAQAKFRLGKYVNLHWFIGQLDEYVEWAGTTKVIYNRFLAGHMWELSVGPANLSFSELMLFGGVGRRVEMYYMLPLFELHGEQLNHRWDDNTVWILNGKLLLPPVRLRGEIVIDDYQIEHETPGDREPTEAGLAAQVDYGLSFKKLFLTPTVRYELVLNRTFNQSKPWNRYLYEGKPLGAQLGNDFDKISAGIKLFGKDFGGNLDVFYIRKGEGRIDDPWTEPWLDDPNYKEPFPTGVVERKAGFSVDLFYDRGFYESKNFQSDFSVSLSLEYSRVANADHIEGKERNEWKIKFALGLVLFGKGF